MSRSPIAIAAAAALALAAAGCGAATSGRVAGLRTGAATTASGPLAFSACMRANGVARFPDPGASGRIPKVGLAGLGVSSVRFRSAQSACAHLLPNGGRPPDQAQIQRVRAQSLAFARCVRAHGVAGFPDPDSSGRIPDPASVGIDQGAPRFQAANTACAKWRPPYMPSNAAYDAYARTHGGG